MLAHRIASQSIGGEGDEHAVGELCQFLSTLLVLQGATGVQEVREGVIRQLQKWQQEYRGEFTEVSAGRCVELLGATEYVNIQGTTPLVTLLTIF